MALLLLLFFHGLLHIVHKTEPSLPTDTPEKPDWRSSVDSSHTRRPPPAPSSAAASAVRRAIPPPAVHRPQRYTWPSPHRAFLRAAAPCTAHHYTLWKTDFPAVRLYQLHNGFQSGGLARSVTADKTHNHSLFHGKRYILQLKAWILLAQIPDPEYLFHNIDSVLSVYSCFSYFCPLFLHYKMRYAHCPPTKTDIYRSDLLRYVTAAHKKRR